MKKIFIILAAVLFTVNVFAQTPEKMSYQSVIRNSENNLVVNTQVGIQVSILQGSVDGTAIYVETQMPTTNANGLASIEIGNGTVVNGDFSSIDWSNNSYFIKTETDPTGGSNYTITGVSQLLSVPYALHAKTAESVANIDITGNETAFDGWDKDAADDFDGDYNSLTNTPTIPIVPSNVSEFTNDAGYVTENTQLTETEVDAMVENNGYLTNETQNLEDVLTQNNSAGNNKITNLADPTEDNDAVNKAYVDALEAQLTALETAMVDAGIHPSKFRDTRDSTIYKYITIGNQVWMAENLKYLPSVVGPDTGSGTEAYYYVYGYDSTDVSEAKATDNYQTYGVLYNWTAAMAGASSSDATPSGVQGVCPVGWHLPSAAEWTTLTDYLGGTDVAGNKLKEIGLEHWQPSNSGATNETGFTALPGGYFWGDYQFHHIGFYGVWWSSTEINGTNAWSRNTNNNYDGVGIINDQKMYGLSVRCVRD